MTTDKYRGFGQDSDSGRNYATGAWGSGELDAAGLAAKYNLDTSQEGRGDGHIWGRNADGSEVYIGKSSMDLASNTDLIAAHSRQANSEEDDHSSLKENLSSAGDIKGAILTEWKGGNAAAAPAPAPAPSPPPKPVPTKLSKEVATAIGRAEAFEDTVRPQYGNYLIGGDESVIDDFEKSATEKIEEASKPYFDDDVNRQDAQEYADKYKLMLGGGLTLTPIV